VPPRWRIARQVQYEQYIMNEVVPLVRQQNQYSGLGAIGTSFGGYHALNAALRHPDIFTAMLSMSGSFDPSNFLRGYYDDDCYFNIPMHYLPNISDSWYLDRYRRNNYILATGVHDQCWNDNERMAQIFRNKSIPCRLDVWGDNTGHDWPWWQRMLQTYL
jgi:esterase/lipase superfamily enzyme